MEAVDKSMIKEQLYYLQLQKSNKLRVYVEQFLQLGIVKTFLGIKVLLIEVKYRDKKNEEIETFNNEEFIFPFLVAAMDWPVHISQNCILHLSSLSSQPILA